MELPSKDSIPRRILGFVVPVGLGALVLLMLQRAREEPPRRPPDEQGRAVRVIEVTELEVVPSAVGYGVVRSSREWKLVAEVSGRVTELSDSLKDGRIIRKGEPLIKIDPRDFELTAVQQKAIVANAEAQLAELKTKERNTRASLTIAEESLELARKEFDQFQNLERGGAVSSSEVDNAEISVLNQRQTVQNYKNTLAEIPATRRTLRAQLQQYVAGAETAELSVSRTEIDAPFDVRIRSVNVALSELVTVGATLAEGDGIALAEVPAQFSIGLLQPLMSRGNPQPVAHAGAGIEPLSARALGRIPATEAIQATVTLESGPVQVEWEARFDRFSVVNSDTRTVSVVVSVDAPFGRPGTGVNRPPLVSGMYVEVELRGEPRPGCKAVPRGALHGSQVHVVNAQQRLELRQVEIAFVQDEFACIESGVEVGESIVLTELVPAIEGTLLMPRADELAHARLLAAAGGEGIEQ